MPSPSFQIGCDLVQIDRIAEVVERHTGFLSKHFAKSECVYFASFGNPYPHIAGHFAAKEAVAKALGWGMRAPLDFRAVSISHDEFGRPLAHLHGMAHDKWRQTDLQISISHTDSCAMAVAVAISNCDEIG